MDRVQKNYTAEFREKALLSADVCRIKNIGEKLQQRTDSESVGPQLHRKSGLVWEGESERCVQINNICWKAHKQMILNMASVASLDHKHICGQAR